MKYYQTEYLGDFSLDDAYYFYLTNPSQDWDGVVRKPTRSLVANSMRAAHLRKGGQDRRIAEELVNLCLTRGNRLLFWSDHHFNHLKIIEYGDRPYASVPQMHTSFINNYLKSVTSEDVVIFGGDLAFGGWQDVAKLFKDTPAYKIYVLGNHDVSPKTGEIPLLDLGVFDAVVMCLSLEINNQTYWVTHYPVDDLLIPPGVKNLHGHTHQNKYFGNPDTHFNMSVEKTGYRPITLEELLLVR